MVMFFVVLRTFKCNFFLNLYYLIFFFIQLLNVIFIYLFYLNLFYFLCIHSPVWDVFLFVLFLWELLNVIYIFIILFYLICLSIYLLTCVFEINIESTKIVIWLFAKGIDLLDCIQKNSIILQCCHNLLII